MSAPTIFASVVTNPGGTGSTITPALSTHAAGDVLEIFIGKTGNVPWTAPAGWTTKQQLITSGSAAASTVGTLIFRRVLPGDTLPLASPVCNLGATVTRGAVCQTRRGTDVEGVHVLSEWQAFGTGTGTSNPVRPASITTLAPEMEVSHYYCQRAATNAPEPTDYTQTQQIVISGTLVINVATRTVADQTTLSNQDASPTSGARWVAMISAAPSPDYPYYRSGSQAFNSNGTAVTPALPAGTTANDNRGNGDLIVLTGQCAGAEPTLNTPGDWTPLPDWSSTTSGGATTVRKWAALYTGTLDRQVNRTPSGEIFAYLSVYHNAHQTIPVGTSAVQQNASSTTSPFPSLPRTGTKATIQATCVADGTPTFTAPSGWTERNDSQGVTCADQSFNTTGTTPSASFTLNSASPTLAGLMEVFSVASAITLTLTPENASLAASAFTPQIVAVLTPTNTSLSLTTFAPSINIVSETEVIPDSVPLAISTFALTLELRLTPAGAELNLTSLTPVLLVSVTLGAASLALISFAPDVTITGHVTVTPTVAILTLTSFAPVEANTTPGYRASVANSNTTGSTNPTATIAPLVGDLLLVYVHVAGNTNDAPTCTDDNDGTYDLVDVVELATGGVDYRLSVFVRTERIANTDPTVITVDTGANSAWSVHLYALRNIPRAGSEAVRGRGEENNQPSGNTPAPTLDQSALSGNVVLLALGSIDDFTSQPPTGWIKRHETGVSGPSTGMQTATRNFGFTGTTVTYSTIQIADFCSHVLELDASPVGITLSPANAALTLTMLAAQVGLAVTPENESLVITAFAPSLQTAIIPASASLTLTGFAPFVTLTVTVPNAVLSLTAFAPDVDVAADITVSPSPASLSVTPSTVQLRKAVTPDSQSLSLTSQAPTLVTTITPLGADLSLESFAPTVTLSTILTPLNGDFTIAALAPSLHETVTPVAAVVVLSSTAPNISAHVAVTPETQALLLLGHVPALRERLTPSTDTLSLTTFAPVVLTSGELVPDAASLTINGFPPLLRTTITPDGRLFQCEAFAPTVRTGIAVTPLPGTIAVAGFALSLWLRVTPLANNVTLLSYAPNVQTAEGDFHPRNIFNTSRESRILGISRESRAVIVSRERKV